jgi:outer membrane protein assembly factor BamC
VSALLALTLLAGCSSIRDVMEGERVDYKTSGAKGSSLDIPPDLTQLSRETRYVVPGTAVSANSYQVGQPTQAVQTAAVTVGDVRIERAGSQRWLVVNRPADKLWSPVRDFWLESGFLLAQDQENLGIMETDYAENRAKLPQDFIRSAIGKVFDGLYSTGERDKFRTRLERRPDGGTEIYVSHRGMVEVITGGKTGNAASRRQHGLAAPSRRPGTRSRIPAPPDGQAGRDARAVQGPGGRGCHQADLAHRHGQQPARRADRRRL